MSKNLLRRFGLVWFGIAFLGCGSDLKGLEGDEQPYAVVRGQVQGFSPLPFLDLDPGQRSKLRAGILWLGVQQFVPYCFEYGPTPFDPGRFVSVFAQFGCRDPLTVVPGRMTESVAISLEAANIEIPIFQLPNPDLLVGPPGARVGYAALVVFEDEDGDGLLHIGSVCDPPEPIHAYSFDSIYPEHERLVYLEGVFDTESKFYPHPDCSTVPSPGFSIWRLPPYLSDPADPNAVCSVYDLDQRTIFIQRNFGPSHDSVGSGTKLGCEQPERETFERPPDQELEDGEIAECVDAQTIAVRESQCPCPFVRLRPLSGCYDTLECENPDWDFRDDPPEYWESICPGL